MSTNHPLSLGEGIYLIDGLDLGIRGRTGSYLFAEEEAVTIIETGPSPSAEPLLAGLKALGLSPEQIRYIIVTHIHLDHAGGVGLLLKHCPQAEVVVHPRGARHLAEPSRLIAGAEAIYKERFQSLFHPVLPVPEDRLIIKNDGETLQLGADRQLHFLDTPGHARHHFSIYDPVSQGVFTGDTCGAAYILDQPEDDNEKSKLFLPVTSPNHFDPEAMKNSIERLFQLDIKRIYFGHFGMTTQIERARQQVLVWLDRFVSAGEEAYQAGRKPEELAEALWQEIWIHYPDLEKKRSPQLSEVMKLDLYVSALGIYDYLSKKAKS